MSSSDQPEAGRIFTCGLPPRRAGAPTAPASVSAAVCSTSGGGGAGHGEPRSYGAAGAEMSPSATGPASTVTIPGLLTADLPTTDEHQAACSNANANDNAPPIRRARPPFDAPSRGVQR